MCGIAGIYDTGHNPIKPSWVIDMTDTMEHRGPDDDGLVLLSSCRNLEPYSYNRNKRKQAEADRYNIGLGHRRLSIIDLSDAGHQPMCNEDGTVWITYNGEIYNYQDLRSDLAAKGHRFKSNTDTEVIIHLYEEMGEDCVQKLNGIFAFAIWDSTGKKLFLARDRFGVKPLYYTFNNKKFIFASEIKSLFKVPGVAGAIDLQSMAEHFTFQNTFGERTLFKDIKLLPQGHTMLLKEDSSTSERSYWDIEYNEDYGQTEEYYIKGLKERFENGVRSQLVSDVPLGTYLSGGMDTGSISAVTSKYIDKLHTFTCGFDTSGVSEEEMFFDETKESEELSSLLNTIHHQIILKPGDMEKVLPKVVWHLDEPRVGISYQNYYVTELISKFVTVVLSGVGGDEFFAGYPWRYEPILNIHDPELFDRTYYDLWVRFLDDNEKKKLFSDRVNAQLTDFSTYDSFKAVTKNTRAKQPLNRAMYFDAKTFLNGLFIVEDKLSMAHSIESRVPFLDNDFIDFTLSIPPELKFKDGNIKHILKKAMEGLLPKETLYRRKQGFTPPDKSWYKGGTLKYIKGLILSDRALERDYFKEEYLNKILDDHLSGRENNRFLIWSLMSFELMNRIFIDGDRVAG